MKFLLSIFLFVLTLKLHAALSPWYSAYNLLTSAFKQDDCLQVNTPEYHAQEKVWKIAIDSCSIDKAKAWQRILSKKYKDSYHLVKFRFEGKEVRSMAIRGKSREEKVAALIQLLETAFSGNKLFSTTHNTDCQQSCFYSHAITMEFQPVVIQTYLDDLRDYHGQRNLVAQEHYALIVSNKISGISIGFTSSRNLD